MSNLLTHSRLRVWRDCKRKHQLMYGEGWRPRVLARKGPRPSTRPGPARPPAPVTAPAEPTPFDDDSDIPF